LDSRASFDRSPGRDAYFVTLGLRPPRSTANLMVFSGRGGSPHRR